MDKPLISIIVPIYKVEKYLERCVQSIVDQTYKNLEIILVDDGSPDNCPAMCDAWAKRDCRIKVIHKENGGLSDARNAGMAIANGELMGFVDSDDWIAPDMYQHLHDLLDADDSDIAACGVEMVWEDGTPSRMLTKSGCCVLDREEAMRAIIEESWLKQPVWYKLYRTALIRDILFPVGKYHEDVFWSYQAVARARKVSVSDKIGYYYFQRSGSIMGESYSLKRLYSLEAKVLRLTYVQEHFPQLVPTAQRDLLFSCMYVFQMCLQYLSEPELGIGHKKIAGIIDAAKPFPRKIGIPLKQLVWYYLSQLSFAGTCKLRNKLKIGL